YESTTQQNQSRPSTRSSSFPRGRGVIAAFTLLLPHPVTTPPLSANKTYPPLHSNRKEGIWLPRPYSPTWRVPVGAHQSPSCSCLFSHERGKKAGGTGGRSYSATL
ncbi:unnamed protein product, partial [Laminaria digitata]